MLWEFSFERENSQMRLKRGALNLTGLKFNRWTVVKQSEIRKCGNVLWLCRCDCGIEREVIASHLNRGLSQSCGCFLRDKNSEVQTTHGMSRHLKSRMETPLYSIWRGMKNRCLNKKSYGYRSYGAVGITVCDTWINDFINFYNDMMPTYQDGLTLERKDGSRGYSPDNCKWATRAEQARNRKTSVFIDTLEGKITVAEAARKVGITQAGMMSRVLSNWPIERLLVKRKCD